MTLNVMPAVRRERASRMQERDGAVGRVAMGPAASKAPPSGGLFFNARCVNSDRCGQKSEQTFVQGGTAVLHCLLS